MEFKNKRDRFLSKLWESTEGDEHESRDLWEIGKDLGYSNTDIRKIGQYLRGEGHIRDRSDQGEISITHEGIKAVEKTIQKGNIRDPEKEISRKIKIDPKKVFVVHGRNERVRKDFFALLRSMGLDPIEWGVAIKMAGEGSPYPHKVLDTVFSHAQAIVVLLTGDDVAKLKKEFIKPDDKDFEKNLTPQARPNVLFEAGIAFGKNPIRTILVELENDEKRPFSDVLGRLIVRLSNKPESRNELLSRLETAGCAVETRGKQDWMSLGNFDIKKVNQKIETKELSKSNQNQKDDQEMELGDEHYWILIEIAEHEDDSQDENILYRGYKEKFPDKDNIDFKIVIDELRQNKSIQQGKSYLGAGVFYIITSIGLKILKEKRKKKG